MPYLIILKKLWPFLVGAALLITIVILHLELNSTKASLANVKKEYSLFKTEVINKTAAALEADRLHAQAVAAADNRIRDAKEQDLQARLATANSDARAYADKLRHQTTNGSSGTANKPSASNPSANPTNPSADPILDDAEICAENTVKAQGWQDWWNEVSKMPR